MNMRIEARFGFLGMLNFCDDGGNHPASSRTLKAEVFPSDDLSTADVQMLVDEMLAQGLVVEYAASGKTYWHVTGWHHQRIDRPTFKHPPFPGNSTGARNLLDEASPTIRRALVESSSSEGRVLDPVREGKGEEGRGVEEVEGANSAAAEPSAPADSCPHQQIIELFHEVLPAARRVREWTPARQQALRARWREKAERQNLDWWRKFFGYVSASDFLCGRTKPTPGRKPFDLSLDWLCKSENLVKVVEGAYEN
ncbi:hypothetical protein [Variovorax saccharolyticus]|uniref:hypothetical protein n=1 Tax=Variovorax saccharolyticus TaxID=3053516 RepID=UPI002574C70C|nr:hypothetical protein [Variovorax sp. J22R187]MDM0018384.1 hypothetical protein [Variovorax sp. J22R187]